jgi:nondiscriminating aspartyl-tRNA synthetase
MGAFSFAIIRTGDGFVQCVIDGADLKLKCESSVKIQGERIEDARAPGGFEIRVSSLEVLSEPSEPLPVAINKGPLKANTETDLLNRPITLRNGYKREIFRLQGALTRGFREFFYSEGFEEIFSPKIVATGAEGGANIFKLDYFGRKAFLTQSPQFYKQLMIPVYGKVFEIGPVFRAEKHDTPRHLNEYVSVDMEMGFIDSFYDVIDTETRMLKFAFNFVEQNYVETLKRLKITIPKIPDEIPRIKFKEAKERVAEKFKRKIKTPYDLEPEEERFIGELFSESRFVFVTHYPEKKRPFYAKDDPEDRKYTLSFDLLFDGMEITTGGQRIHDYEEQKRKMIAKGLDPADFESYLALHKYGAPPHGGFGMGIERLVMKLINEKNIRNASLFPRDANRLEP